MSPPSILDLPEEEKRKRLTRMGMTEEEYRAQMEQMDREIEEAGEGGFLEDAPEGSYEPGKWGPENDPQFEPAPDDDTE